MLCYIYKSPKKQEMYLYVNARDAFDDVPEALLQPFGKPIFVMILKLTPERALARENAESIIDNLATQGYHLQIPPPPEILSPMSKKLH